MSITQALREMAEEARKQATEHEGPSSDLTKDARHKKGNELVEQFLIQEGPANDNGVFPSIDPSRAGGQMTYKQWVNEIKTGLKDALYLASQEHVDSFDWKNVAYAADEISVIAKTLAQK